MITIKVKHEGGDGVQSGYGIYVNAYVTWDDEGIPILYASECVPFGSNTKENLQAAERRVCQLAEDLARREYIGEDY